MKVQCRSQPEKLPDKIVYNYEKADYQRLRERLDIDWTTYLQTDHDDIEEMWGKFILMFNQAEKEFIPQKVVKTGKRKFSHPIDKKTLSKRKKKYRLWKRYLESRDAKVYEEYCRCRNQVRRLTRQGIKVYERNIAEKSRKNGKVFWKYINSKVKMRSAVPELYTTNKHDPQKMTKNDHEKANILRNFFSSVYVKEPDWSWILRDEDKPYIKEDLRLNLTKEDILQKLLKLNANKSPGSDNVQPRVIKELDPVLVDPLFIIFELSLKLGKVPSAWKLATVTAIFKNKGNKHDPRNYRPISLTSIACRILESIFRDSIMGYLKTNSILSDKQFGFLGGRSTILQLLIAMDEWTEILDRGGAMDVIYCDFQKAFDTVAHNRLMDALCHYGLKDPILSWIEDYLKNRKQQVSVNGSKSSLFDVSPRVPQGSVLGPLLFIIYINSMVVKAGDTNLLLYADDVKLYREIKTDEDVETLQTDLDKLYDWTQYSLLKFHPDKCVVMRLMSSRSKKLKPNALYNMDERRLKAVSEEKDLGISFNDNLTFEKHINEKVNKANSLVGMVRRTFVYLDKDVFKVLFISIVRPHLEYGAPIWNPYTKKLINQIENVQRRAT